MIELHRIADMYGITVKVRPYKSDAVDGGGNPVPGYGTPFNVERVVFDPGNSYEPVANNGAGSLRVITNPTLLCPAGTSGITDKSQVVVGTDTYEVDGLPRVWPAGVVVTLKRVDG